MKRAITFGWLALGLIAAGSGCSSCASPYDYTGPLYEEGHLVHERLGSIFSDPNMHGYVLPSHEPTPAQVIEESVPTTPAPGVRTNHTQRAGASSTQTHAVRPAGMQLRR